MTTGPTPPTGEPAASADLDPAPSRRRRLWEVPGDALEVIVGLAMHGDVLRRLAESAVGRQRGLPCRLVGTDADLLYSVVHDLATRNPLSEAVERHLTHAFTPSIRDARRARDADALRRWWTQAALGGTPVGAAWAVLVHPSGVVLQDRVRFDLKTWAWQEARAGARARDEACELRRQVTALAADIERQRVRCQDVQRRLAQADQTLGLREAELAGLRARTAAAPVQPPTVTDHGARPSDARPPARLRETPRGAEADRRSVQGGADTAAASIDAHLRAVPVTAAGLRVLCVGGVRHAVSRYRAHAERLGARFEHHDGGVEDALPRLDGPLGRADLVVCQAACINHEAYHRIKRHCSREGTACVYLERPSVARFAQALERHLPVLANRPAATGPTPG